MITPIRRLTIEQICERKKDLLVSADDIKEVARNAKNKAIDEFAERLLENAPRNFAGGLELGGLTCYLSANKVMEIAEQMKENEFFNFSSPVVSIDEKSYNKAIDECIKVIEETAWKDTDMLVESIRELKGVQE